MNPRGEEGVTLVELLVTMLILSIVSLMLFTFMDGITSVTARTERHVQAEQDAQIVLRKMTEEIRAANPILDSAGCAGAASGFADCLRFDIQRTTEFEKPCVRRTVSYKLNRTAQVITRDATDWVWSSAISGCVVANTTTRVVIESLNYPTSTPLFVYTDNAGDPVGPTLITLPPNQDGTAAVKVNLRLNYQKRNAPSLVLSSNAVLRNNR